MKQLVKYFFLLALVFLVSSCTNSGKKTGDTIDNPIINLPHWQYFTGNLNPGTKQNQISVKTLLASKDWKPLLSPDRLPENYKAKNIWLKTELPDWQGPVPAVYIGQINYGMNLFLNDRLIYRIGNFSSSRNHFIGWDQNLVQLPFFRKGDVLMIRLRLGDKQTGIKGRILLGSSEEIIKTIFVRDLDNVIFSVVFLLFGIVILILYFMSYKLEMVLGMFVFLISAGIFITVNTTFFKILFHYPQIFYQLDYSSIVVLSIATFYTIEKIVSVEYKKIISFIWKLHVAILILFILLINFTRIIYLDILNYFLFLATINIVISLVALVLSAKKGNYQSKILAIGLSGFLFFSIIENILYFVYGAKSNFGYNVRVVHYGVLLFAGSMVWAAVRKYIDTNKQKEMMKQKELEAIKRENEARRNFSARLLESQENERNRIAMELHDSIGQKLLLVKNWLFTEINERPEGSSTGILDKISDLTGETLQEIRDISQNLRPSYLDQLGLTTAIEALIENVEQSSSIKIRQNIQNIDGLIPGKKEINVFRIVQESFNNILKHSKATEASIKIEKYPDVIKMEIKDNGIGSRSSENKADNGIGISDMYERARMIGANMDITISESEGSTVYFEYRLK